MTREDRVGNRAVSTNSDAAGLRARIRTLAAQVGAPGEPGYLDAAERLIAVGAELVEAEEQVRQRKRNRRRRTKVVSVISGAVLGLECLGLSVAGIAGAFSPLWLLMLVPLTLGGVLIVGSGFEKDTEKKYPPFWQGALLIAGADVSAALVVTQVIPGGWSALTISLALMGFGAFVPDTPSKPDGDEVNDAVPEEIPALPSSADEHVSSLIKQVRTLEGQLASLSSAVARAGLPGGADLDVVTSEDAALVARITRGRGARNQLLSTPERSGRLAVLTEAAHANLDLQDAAMRAVKAVEVLGATRPRDEDYARSVTDLREAREEVERAKSVHQNAAARAARCADELKADDSAAGEIADVLGDGESAYAQLLDRTTVRLRGEIERAALLPTWFIVALGPTPPPNSPDAWYDAAARVVAYRLVYAVRTQDSPLGPEPSGRPDHTRLSVFAEIQDTLRGRSWAD